VREISIPATFKLVRHFPPSDPGCLGDYHYLDITLNDDPVISYGDHYHDKGEDKAQGFLHALRFIYGRENILFTEESKADSEY